MENNNDEQTALSGLLNRGNIVYGQDETFIRLYANSVQFTLSLWDANIVFGEIIGEKDGQSIVLEKTKVNMSKEMAKTLMLILQKNIRAYEVDHGEIKLPDVETFTKLAERQRQAISRTAKKRPKKA